MTVRALGVDMGGSSTRAVVVDIDTGAIDEHTYPGKPIGMATRTVEALVDIVAAARADFCGVSLAGAGRRRLADEVSAIIESRTGVPSVVVGDFIAAHYSCFGEKPGAVLVAGTGSVCYARATGNHGVLVGGHGPPFGDEGSAWWIGSRAIAAVFHAADGTGPRTELTDILDDVVPDGRRTLRSWGADLSRGRGPIARLAPFVDRAARTDPVAAAIMSDAAHALINLALAAQRELGALPVGLIGGVFESSLVRDAVSRTLDAFCGPAPMYASVALGRLTQARAWRLAPGTGSPRPDSC